MSTLQGIHISHLGKRKIIFKMAFFGDMLVSWRVAMKLKCGIGMFFSQEELANSQKTLGPHIEPLPFPAEVLTMGLAGAPSSTLSRIKTVPTTDRSMLYGPWIPRVLAYLWTFLNSWRSASDMPFLSNLRMKII